MFNYHNPIVQDDIKAMAVPTLPWDKFQYKTILVTGATGMLATYIIYLLIYLRKEKGISLQILALCRNKQKANDIFHPFQAEAWFQILNQDVCDTISYNGNIDYIFHLAGNASPYFINNDPVGIIKSNLLGTLNILELALEKKSQKVLFTSTREIYGKNESMSFLKECDYGIVNPIENRACYPESKRAAETLIRSYYLQFHLSSSIVRIAHSYGPGMKLANDGRVMADLLSDAIEGKNIVLKSTGTAERAFCYISDAVLASFYVLFLGENAQPYNVANETEPISIKDLASLILNINANNKLQIVYDIPSITSTAYCNYKRSGLDTTAIEKLGWMPQITLKEGITKTINSFKL